MSGVEELLYLEVMESRWREASEEFRVAELRRIAGRGGGGALTTRVSARGSDYSFDCLCNKKMDWGWLVSIE